MNENIRETVKLHNTYLNEMANLEYINQDMLNVEHNEILLSIKTLMNDEIDKIRKELKINTCTMITEEDVEKMQN